ncbi:SDR family NAD(P)-dependent oxidoreductase, partial [Bacillus haynesii]
MKKQVALVTGAAGGIGFEIAREFAREGASVIVSDLHQEAC